MNYLQLNIDFETKAVLKKLSAAHRALAELKGILLTIPNQQILIETLTLSEARESSAIENIISTLAELYQSNQAREVYASHAAKEVHHYAKALKKGFALVRSTGLLTNNHVLAIQAEIEHNHAGFRKFPGTKLLNEQTGEIIYTPPQSEAEIIDLMNELEKFINDDSILDIDPLIKMAIIHHQFESIHPFYDGNGRTGRIINILYLVLKGLLELPVLYLSRFIIKRKPDYYRMLQHVRESGDWEEWILFFLQGVEQISKESVILIVEMKRLMQESKETIRGLRPKIYSQDLINNLFRYPYTKIELLQADLGISRSTAIRHLESLVDIGMLRKQRIGRESYYINERLFLLLTNTAVLNP